MKKISIYPKKRVLEFIGSSAKNLHNALERFDSLLRAVLIELEKLFSRADWCFLADANNGVWHQNNVVNPAPILALGAMDSHRLNKLGDKWYKKQPDKRVKELVEKLQNLSAIQAWSVIRVCERFWENSEINIEKDKWWQIK